MQRHIVCKREDLTPGSMRAIRASGRRIAVACLAEGSYRAVSDTCPHGMASLSRGRIEKMWTSDKVGYYRTMERWVIICPRHNFEFNLDTGLSPCEPDRIRIKAYKTCLESDEVVVYV